MPPRVEGTRELTSNFRTSKPVTTNHTQDENMDSASSKSKDPSQIAFLRRLKKRKQPDGEEGDKSKDKERKKPRVERKFNKPKQPRPVGQKKEKKPKEDNESSKDVKEKPKKPAKSALVELSEEKVETGAFGRFKAAVLRASRGNKSTLSKLELEDSLVNGVIFVFLQRELPFEGKGLPLSAFSSFL